MNKKTIFAFSLIELLLVVGILSILAAIGLMNFSGATVRAKIARVTSDMRTIAVGLEGYAADHNDYPNNYFAPFGNLEIGPNNVHLPTGYSVTPWNITTPIAYMTLRPADPFRILPKGGYEYYFPKYKSQVPHYAYYKIIPKPRWISIEWPIGSEQYYSTATSFIAVHEDATTSTLTVGGPDSGNRGAFLKYGRWLQFSVGPDGLPWIATDDFRSPGDPINFISQPPKHLPWGYSFDVPYDPTNGSASFGNVHRVQIDSENILPVYREEFPRPKPENSQEDIMNELGIPVEKKADPIATPAPDNLEEFIKIRKNEKWVVPIDKQFFSIKNLKRTGKIIFVSGIVMVALYCWLKLKAKSSLVRDDNHTMITDAYVRTLPDLKLREELDLAGSQITDMGLACLKNMPLLKFLNLWNTQITDNGLAYFEGLNFLESINLSDTCITNAGLFHLRKLPMLAHLVLMGTEINDGAIIHLEKIPTLKSLVIRNTKISPQGIDQLATALPSCEILHDGIQEETA